MHKNLYIDVDEEVTSVVDRLRKTRTEEVIIIVPKGAMLLQSIVNLKLLKKEAQKAGRQIMIVTQDDRGKVLIEKAGILVQDSFEEMEAVEDIDQKENELKAKEEDGKKQKADREIGSEDFYASEKDVKTSQKESKAAKKDESLLNKELITTSGARGKKTKKHLRKQAQMMDIVGGGKKEKKKKKKEEEKDDMLSGATINKEQEKTIRQFFSKSDATKSVEVVKEKEEKREVDDYPKSTSHKGVWKYFVVLIIITLGAAVFFGAAFILPRVTVSIFAKSKTYSLEMEVSGNTTLAEADLSNNSIPARTVTLEQEITKEFTASGKEQYADKKARGIVTIYNEYNSSPQTLVATTRLLTEDGKLFRLEKQVTVPGMKGSEPGSTEAQVIADQAGEEYNIGTARFSVPGFKGNPKYDKFYAKSELPMTGGGGDNSEAVSVISRADLELAKEELEKQSGQDAVSGFQGKLENGEMAIASTIESSVERFVPSQSEGSASDSFAVSAKVVSTALAVKEADIYAVVAGELKERYGTENIKNEALKLEFSKEASKDENGAIVIPIKIEYKYIPPFDEGQIKKDIAGKSSEDARYYFEGLGEIEKVEISYWPIRIGEGIMPQKTERIKIEIK